MNTKNTKTAVIILLLIANIFFIYNILRLKISTENIPAEMIDNAVSILEKKGFLIDRSKVPGKKPASMMYEGVYEGVYSHSPGTFAEIVRNFSGASDEEMKDAADMFGPAGTSYAAGEYRFVFADADNFRISITDKTYTGEINEEETEAAIRSLSEKRTDGAQKSDIKKAEKIIKNFIKKYQNQDVKLGFDVTGFKKDGYKNRECVLINQTVDGIRIDSHIAYIEIQDGKVKYFSGKWYFGECAARRRPLLDSVNILFRCADDGNIGQNGGRLIEMDAEYVVMFHDAEEFYFVPSWRLELESGRQLSYNMITGD